MNKFYGIIGFSKTEETSPGVWTESITEQNYYGDIIRRSKKYQSTSNLNDDIDVNLELSVLLDDYISSNLSNLRYVNYMGTKWKIINVNIEYPRVTLTVGGIYNG